MSKEDAFDPDVLLHPGNMIQLYARGYFPMAESGESDNINFYLPDVRAVIPIYDYKIPRSLRQFMKKKEYTITADQRFEDVINYCSQRSETWINSKLKKAYAELFKAGFLHTIEVYYDGELAGGLYGITISGAFMGESMFSLQPQASKIALVHLISHLRRNEFVILDSQIINEHTRLFGAYEISDMQYQQLLDIALNGNFRFTDNLDKIGVNDLF